ncbi:hypothetical protein [Marinicella meishanensis]|uniref:hypothetical protein n=1 Tax=Marinicella meishanensis TaxID=2873263 RepID=UPI001CBB2C8D|nr:hypothetical protein [Marinicella sp. NBU2979]
MSAHSHAAEPVQPFKPFDIAGTPNTQSINMPGTLQSSQFLPGGTLNSSWIDSDNGFDFLGQQDRGYLMSTNKQGLFGDELVVGMKFADWLTLRLNVIDDSESMDLFATNRAPVSLHNGSDLVGYQFGVSSVMNISENWRLGFDLGRGRVGGDLIGLYQDQLHTTSLGFGIRNQKFGATFQSDIMNRTSDNAFEQATMDLQVDWHFTKDGTISFGARRSVNDNTTSASLEQLRGTVPYIKFKHNL